MSRIGIVLSSSLLFLVSLANASPAESDQQQSTLRAVRWSQREDGLQVVIETPPPASFSMSWDLGGPSVRLELAQIAMGSHPVSVIDVNRGGVRSIRLGRMAQGGTAVSVDFESIPSGELRVRSVGEGIVLTIPPPEAGRARSLAGSGSSGTQDRDDRERLEARIAELERRLSMTERRIAQVEVAENLPSQGETGSVGSASNDVSTSPTVAEARQETQEPPPLPPTAPEILLADVHPVYPNLKFAGFSNLDYAASDGNRHGNGFRSGQFVLQLSSPLSDRIQVFGELALTAHEDNFAASVERYILSISQSDALRLSFGRFHTPVSWWNTEFHHGLWLQTSIERPYMVNFGSRFLPIHAVGAFAGGRLPTAPLNLEYEVGVGNGRAGDLAEPAQAGDVNNHRSMVFRLSARPGDFSRLAMGGSYYIDRLTQPGLPDYNEHIGSAFFAWTRETPELVAEYFHVRHLNDFGPGAYNSWAAYGQVAYRLPWLHAAFKPYFRYERTEVNQGDPIFDGYPGLRADILGLRYDFSLFAALKAEFQRRRSSGTEPYNAGIMQIAFTF